MKHFLILIFLFSLNASADWVKVSDFDTCGVTGYYDKHTCENEQASTCAKRPQGYESDCNIFNLSDATVDDLEKPIWGTRSMVEQCADAETCQLIHANKECVDGRQSFWSEDDLEVWCNKITGHEQKFSHKIAVIDQVRFNQREADKLAYEQEALLEKQITLRMECGNKTIIESSKMNAKKGFTNTQVMAFSAQFADIANLLKLGATDSAKELIDATEPNALISQQELDSLSSFLVNCVGAN